jgi:hypothetical protein
MTFGVFHGISEGRVLLVSITIVLAQPIKPFDSRIQTSHTFNKSAGRSFGRRYVQVHTVTAIRSGCRSR